MARADLLSQDEIDALLHGVDSGDVDTGAAGAIDGVGSPFDLASQERIVRSRMPTLEMINERFSRYFQISLFNMLRRPTEITVADVQMMKFSEYMHSLPVPASLNVVSMNPLRGKALCVIDPKLAFIIVDYYFGGSGHNANIEGREFSLTELRVNQIILEHAIKAQRQAWNPVLAVDPQFVRMDMNQQFPEIVSPSELVVVCSFQIELGDNNGTFYVVMPYSMLEPIRELLYDGAQSDRPERDDHWSAALREKLKVAEVSLSGTLANADLRLGDVLNMKEGDIIPINYPETITVFAEDVPVCHATYGVYKGSKAIKLQKFIKQPGHISED